MKRLLLVPLMLLGSGIAFAQASAAPSPAPVIEDATARQARALLDKMVRALGGDAYLNYQTRQEVGRSYRFYHGNPSGAGVQFWRFWKWPDKDRMELTKQRDWRIIYTGDEGFETTFRGTRKLEEDELKDYLLRREYSNEYILRRWLKEPGVALFYDGGTIAEQKPADKVTIMNARNQGVSFFISADNGLLIKKSYSLRDPQTRERYDEEEVYDNYRLIQGIQTPLSWARLRNGKMTTQRFLNTVTYDAPLADSLFVPGPLNYDKRKK